MMKLIKIVLLGFFIFTSIVVLGQTTGSTTAEAEEQTADAEKTAEQIEDAAETANAEADLGSPPVESTPEPAPVTTEPQQQPAKTKAESKNEETVFIPTEEISDDLPVPFPVDI